MPFTTHELLLSYGSTLGGRFDGGAAAVRSPDGLGEDFLAKLRAAARHHGPPPADQAGPLAVQLLNTPEFDDESDAGSDAHYSDYSDYSDTDDDDADADDEIADAEVVLGGAFVVPAVEFGATTGGDMAADGYDDDYDDDYLSDETDDDDYLSDGSDDGTDEKTANETDVETDDNVAAGSDITSFITTITDPDVDARD